MQLLSKILVVLNFCVFSQFAIADQTAVINPYGKYLSGSGVEVEMAEFVEKNKDGLHDVLLKISGRDAYHAGIDGKTVRYQAVPGGTGIDYKANGSTRMICRNPYGNWWSLTQIFLDGKTIDLSEHEARSKEVRPLHLLTASKEDSKEETSDTKK